MGLTGLRMRSLRCVIVDDETPSRAHLRQLLQTCVNVEIAGECNSVQTAIEMIRELQPDLLLLDIQLGPESGFSIPQALDSPPIVVFVTGYDQYAVRAFEVNAVDYLLKPVTQARLSEAIDRARTRTPAPAQRQQRLQRDDLAVIPLGNSGFFTRVNDILVIEAQNHHSRVTLDTGRVCLVRRPLREWIEILPTDLFQSIDRSFLINVDRIVDVSTSSRGGTMRLGNRRFEVPLGRVAARRVRQLLEERCTQHS